MAQPALKQNTNDAILRQVSEAVRKLQYGTVAIKVHAAKVIQIEVTEKKRFDAEWDSEEGSGI